MLFLKCNQWPWIKAHVDCISGLYYCLNNVSRPMFLDVTRHGRNIVKKGGGQVGCKWRYEGRGQDRVIRCLVDSLERRRKMWNQDLELKTSPSVGM